MSDAPTFPPALKNAHIDAARYAADYQQSITDPDAFWAGAGQRLTWTKPYSKIKNARFAPDVSIKWYEDGELNVAANCLDRHLEQRGDKAALVFVPDDPASETQTVTYRQLHNTVCRFANVLAQRGVQRGDRVIIYLPMVPMAAAAMLACARLGAVHSVVFGGFSPESLKDRIIDCGAKLVITADEGRRGGKTVPLKANVDAAVGMTGGAIEKVLVVAHTGAAVSMQTGRDEYIEPLLQQAEPTHAAVSVGAEDPLFILYTSGSTGKPKGVLHTSGGYLVYASMTHELVFDIHEDDVYWCTADIGWVTGHSYVVYGPLANGATSVMFEGVPTHPTPARFWQIIDQLKVTVLYTAPTAIRGLMREGDKWLDSTTRDSLRVMGSVGEPINPEAWLWYYNKVGKARVPIVDTWWQTETGGILISPLPGATTLKPGSATRPFFGIQPVLVDNDGKVIDGAGEGNLCIAGSWPGQMRTIFGDHERFEQTYFSTFKGLYFTGDGARRDADGDYWITGRVDDVINVAGHRFGTAEIESALITHKAVAESAVVGMPHDLKGQGIYAYVILKEGVTETPELKKELVQAVRAQIGPIATPDVIQFTPGLPKTRSGKIMRRILRKIAAGEVDALGDTSTLADPAIVEVLVKGAKQAA